VSNDQEIRNLIGRVRSRTCEPNTDHEAYELARAAEALVLDRDRRTQDWYASNRRIAHLEAENERLTAEVKEQLAGTRTVEDLRMREIGELNREVRRLRATLQHIAETSTAAARGYVAEGAEVPVRITSAIAEAAERALAEEG
jgi:tyrosyl-tRNA synthetase